MGNIYNYLFVSAPPYLSQHNVVPSKWSYLNYDDPMILSKKHYAIFSMPPPYHSTPDQSKSNLDTNMNSSLTNRNHSNNSSPLIGYDGQPGLLGHDVYFEKCKRNEEFRLFDPNDAVYLDDGMGFDLQSVLSMELLENAAHNPRLVEAKNEEVLRRVAEMQKLVENSQQYLTEHANDVYGENGLPYHDGILRDEFVGKETSVDQVESDSESTNSRMSSADDAPGILKHSDSLLLLTETINQGLSGLNIPVLSENKDNNSSNLSRRQSQGLSVILNNCGLTDALIALNNDLSQSESDNDSLYTPTNSPIRRHHNKSTNNKIVRTSFGLHSPDTAPQDCKEQQNLKEYLKQLREKSSKNEQKIIPRVEVSPFSYREDSVDNDGDLIDLTLIPPPQTPDELDSTTQVPHILPVVPASFADKDNREPEPSVEFCDAPSPPPAFALEEFIANVTIQPPTVKATPAIELTSEQIMSYIIPPPPTSDDSALDRDAVGCDRNRPRADPTAEESVRNEINKVTNGDVVKGTLSVSEIRSIFAAKSLSDARNSLLLREKNSIKVPPPQTKRSDSPRGKRRSVVAERRPNGSAARAIEYPTVERKGVFSCCGKDRSATDDDEGERDPDREIPEPVRDRSETRPPPRRRNLDAGKPPDRPPKTSPAPRPRSNSFTCPGPAPASASASDLGDRFGTLDSRRLTYRAVCLANAPAPAPTPTPTPSRPPPRPPRPLSPPPPLLLPPRRASPVAPPAAPRPRVRPARLASIGSPHLQRNRNAYRNLETERALTPPLENGEAASRRRAEPPPRPARVRFVDVEDDDDVPAPPPPPLRAGGAAGAAGAGALLTRAEPALTALLEELRTAAAACAGQHARGGGEDIDDIKFQVSGEINSIILVPTVGLAFDTFARARSPLRPRTDYGTDYGSLSRDRSTDRAEMEQTTR